MKSLRKVFLPADHAGSDTQYWEAQWLQEPRPFGGPIARLLQANLRSPKLVLEAGCGQGEVAVGLAALGHTVIGVDLASDALRDCRRRHPGLPLVIGDVGRLPFRAGAFDAITSLGVVEHFEAGPTPVLQEHARVASDDAVLLVAVPARGWYRRWSDLLNLRLKRAALYEQRGRWVGLRSQPKREDSDGLTFHQYEFPRRMFKQMCITAGLDVESWQPFGVAWTLGESPLISRMTARIGSDRPPAEQQRDLQATTTPTAQPLRQRARDYLRDPTIDGTYSDPVQRSMAWAASRAMGHMQLLVAKPRRPRAGAAPNSPSRSSRNPACRFSTYPVQRITDNRYVLRTPQYVLRFDDICPTMNWPIWERVEEILRVNGIRPMLAVVPQNADPKLQVTDPNPEFWERARGWQDSGWDLMLHGFDHIYVSQDAGLWGYDARSEFAGVSEPEQRRKITEGLRLFEAEDLRVSGWIGPNDSFDQTTVDLLVDAGVNVICAGFARRPYMGERGATWVPCQLWDFRPRRSGVWTVCMHINSWSAADVDTFAANIERYRPLISDLSEVTDMHGFRRRGLDDIAYVAYRRARARLGR